MRGIAWGTLTAPRRYGCVVGRVENATRLMADRSDAILKLAAAVLVPLMVNASPVYFWFRPC
jgi:hypothetical protein